MATAYGDPNSDVAYTWSDDTSTDYERVNDGVRDPTSPAVSGDGQNCVAGDADDNEIATWGCTEPSISGTVTEVKVKVYAQPSSGSISTNIGAYFNGSAQTPTNHSIDAGTWYTTTYPSLSIPAASLFPWRINITPGSISKGASLTVYGAYLEVTYTAGGGGTTHSRAIVENLGAEDDEGGMQAGETIFLSLLVRRILSQMLGLADSVVSDESTVRARAVAESFAVATLISRSTEFQRDPLETLALGEQPRHQTDAFRAIADQLALLDVRALQSLIDRYVSDTVAAGGEVRQNVLFRLLTADAAGFNGSIGVASQLLRELIDHTDVTDSTARAVVLLRSLLDLAAIVDEAARQRILGNVLPGDADLESVGPADATVDSSGPGAARTNFAGPGNISARPKGSGD